MKFVSSAIKFLAVALGVLAIIAGIISFAVTRDGQYIEAVGEGTVMTDSGTFEAFPLPDYASAVISGDYKSYLVDVEPGIKIHVLEVGTGYPVYLQHGNPTNGLLSRKIVEELPTDRVRLIMPTIVGLGFSSKIPASAHNLEDHIRWMDSALDQLQLEELVYVGQDWGGAIGMGALERNPDLMKGIVVLNTAFTAPTEPLDISRIHAIVKTPVVGELLLENVVSIFDRLKDSQGDPASMPPEVSDLYGRPVLESGNKKGPLALMRMVPDGPDHPTTPALRVVEGYARSLDIPAEIVWGMNDPIFAQALPVMKGVFPNAAVTETQAGHFLQEEVPVEIAAAIMRIVEEVQAEPEVAESVMEIAPDPAIASDGN